MKKPKFKISESESDRIERQYIALDSMMTKSNFGMVCIVTRVVPNSYEEYSMPEDIEQLQFIVKGAIRCEMLDDDNMKKYRRLFGSTKKSKWEEEDIDNLKRLNVGEGLNEYVDENVLAPNSLPNSWKSRVSIKAFEGYENLESWITNCPFNSWSSINSCSLNIDESEGQYVMLQILDVELPDGKKLSETLCDFFTSSNSRLLKYIDHCECLNLIRTTNE